MTSLLLATYLIEQVVMFELYPNWFRFGQAIAVLQMGIRVGLIAPEESNALRQRIDSVADQLPVEGNETNKLEREHIAADVIKQTLHELEQIQGIGSSSEAKTKAHLESRLSGMLEMARWTGAGKAVFGAMRQPTNGH